MKKMKPYKILLFFLALFAVMTGISVIFPGEGIHVGNLQLRYIHISEVIPQNLFRTFDSLLSDSIPGKDTLVSDSLMVQDSLTADTVTDAG
ncbi:MAG: hypothetical protein KJ607_04465, partial [Bacteroidetes bacterium]|nr:hypothetical protein [Bacteroidota bacterium]